MKYLSIADLRMERPVRPIDAPLYLAGTLRLARQKLAVQLLHRLLAPRRRIDVTYSGRWDRTALTLVERIARTDELDAYLVVLSFPHELHDVERRVTEGPFARFPHLAVLAPHLTRPPSVRTAETLAATVARAAVSATAELEERWFDGPGSPWLGALCEDLDDPAAILEAANDALDVRFEGLIAGQREDAVRARRLVAELRRLDGASRDWLLEDPRGEVPEPLRHRFLVRDGAPQRWARWLERSEAMRIARSAFAASETNDVESDLADVLERLGEGQLELAQSRLDAIEAAHPLPAMRREDRIEYRTLALRLWRELDAPERATGHLAPLRAELGPPSADAPIPTSWELAQHLEAAGDDVAALGWLEACLAAEEQDGLLEQSDDTLRELVKCLGRLGEWARARDFAERRLGRVDDTERAGALLQLVKVCEALGDTAASEAHAAEALTLAEADDEAREDAIRATFQVLRRPEGAPASCLALGERALALADRYGIPAALRSGLLVGIGGLKLVAGRPGEAAAAFEEAARFAAHVPDAAADRAYLTHLAAFARAAEAKSVGGLRRALRAALTDSVLSVEQRSFFAARLAGAEITAGHPYAARRLLASVVVTSTNPAVARVIDATRAKVDAEIARRREG